jgi:hypothetical protein
MGKENRPREFHATNGESTNGESTRRLDKGKMERLSSCVTLRGELLLQGLAGTFLGLFSPQG